MSLATKREFFAQVDTFEGLPPAAFTAGTARVSAPVDIIEHGTIRACLSVVFTAGAADAVTATLVAESCDEEDFAADVVELKTYAVDLVDAAAGTHSAVVLLPVKTLAAKRYVRFQATISGDGLAGTPAISGTLTIDMGGAVSDPAAAYNRDGYAKVTLDA